MKNNFKRIILSVIVLTLTIATIVTPQSAFWDMITEVTTFAYAEDGTYSCGGVTYSYTIENECAKLEKVISSSSRSMEIPSKILHNGSYYTVTAIGNEFAENSDVCSISIPSTIKSIGVRFAYGSLVETVSLSSNIVDIGSMFCAGAENLKTVKYNGTKLEKLGSFAFDRTPFITIKNSNDAVTMGDWLIRYLGTSSSVNVLSLNNNNPDITKIADSAFRNNQTLESVDLNGVSIIGDRAFSWCTNLTTIKNTYALRDLGDAFYNNSKLLENYKNANGHVIIDSILVQYNYDGSSTIDLTKSDFNNVRLIAAYALSEAAKTATTLKLPYNIDVICDGALSIRDTKPAIKNIYLYNTKITYSNFLQYDFMQKNLGAFDNTIWGGNILKSKAKDILNSLGIPYVGTGDEGSYTPFEEYQIALKLYDYVGKTYNYKYHYDGGSENFFEELFFPKGIVCVDYAEMYMFLLESAGVNAEIVLTKSHAWNVIEIGNNWFHADACWYSRENWFMIDDETVPKEEVHHSIFTFTRRDIIPTEMYTLNSLPWCYYQMGDVTVDGIINADDVMLLTEYLSGKKSINDNYLYLADLNRDGVIDNNDNTLLKEKVGVFGVFIVEEPTDVSVEFGKKFSTTVTATGDGLTYQWYFKEYGEPEGAKFKKSSIITADYTTVMNKERSGRQVYCVITDKYGNSVQTDTVTLKSKVKITKDLVNVTAKFDEKVSFSVSATGHGLTYKWYFKNKNMKNFEVTETFKTNKYGFDQMTEARAGREVYCEITDIFGNTAKTETIKIYLLGDANCDGKLTEADASAILQALANPDKFALSEQGIINADFSGDNGLTAYDAELIKDYLAK